MKNNFEKKGNLIKIAYILGILILLVVGFAGGYLYADKMCSSSPFIYGVKTLNKINNDEFTCNCISNSGKTKSFSFDEEGFKDNLFVGNLKK